MTSPSNETVQFVRARSTQRHSGDILRWSTETSGVRKWRQRHACVGADGREVGVWRGDMRDGCGVHSRQGADVELFVWRVWWRCLRVATKANSLSHCVRRRCRCLWRHCCVTTLLRNAIHVTALTQLQAFVLQVLGEARHAWRHCRFCGWSLDWRRGKVRLIHQHVVTSVCRIAYWVGSHQRRKWRRKFVNSDVRRARRHIEMRSWATL